MEFPVSVWDLEVRTYGFGKDPKKPTWGVGGGGGAGVPKLGILKNFWGAYLGFRGLGLRVWDFGSRGLEFRGLGLRVDRI